MMRGETSVADSRDQTGQNQSEVRTIKTKRAGKK